MFHLKIWTAPQLRRTFSRFILLAIFAFLLTGWVLVSHHQTAKSQPRRRGSHDKNDEGFENDIEQQLMREFFKRNKMNDTLRRISQVTNRKTTLSNTKKMPEKLPPLDATLMKAAEPIPSPETEKKPMYRLFYNATDVLDNANNDTVHPSLLNQLKIVKAVARRINNRSEPFQMIESEDRQLLRELLIGFDKMAKSNEITYFLYGGSVLGSLRFHGLVPWDDDVDVIIPAKDKMKLKQAVEQLAPNFLLNTLSPAHFKFCSNKSKQLNLYWNITWPYLDISFYEMNQTHLWDIDTPYGRRYAYNLTDILPVAKRPFEELWLPVPRDSYTYVGETYEDFSKCSRNRYSHMLEMGYEVPRQQFACEEVADRWPFVHRELTGMKEVTETLKYKNGTVVKVVTLEEAVPRLLNAYTLEQMG